MTPVILLAFGLCAALASYGHQDTVSIGYVSRGECIVHLVVGESGVFPWAGHDIEVQFIEGGATVTVDEMEYVLQKGEPV